MKPRVVITGIGMVTPLGNSAEETWRGLARGASGSGTISKFDASAYSSRISCELKGFDAARFLTPKETHRTDPFIQYAVAAASMALENARFAPASDSRLRTGVLIGSGRGGVTTVEKNMASLAARGPKAVSPFFTPLSLPNMAAAFVAIKFGAQGPCLDVSTACSTGTHALGEAMKIIQRGDADVMIAGGSEAPITPLILAGFCQAKALSRRNSEPERASRPFDLHRDGFVLSEGAAVLVLETLHHAERRGAPILAEMAGYGLSSDAYHLTRPDPEGEGSSRAMSLALSDAGLVAAEVDYVNAHGTSTQPNDRIETLALKRTFGDHARKLVLSSTKSMLGHALGAAGAIEAAVTVLAIRDGIVPPTINLDHPDPECDLDYVPNSARPLRIGTALSNSLGFGGMNAALVLKKFSG